MCSECTLLSRPFCQKLSAILIIQNLLTYQACGWWPYPVCQPRVASCQLLDYPPVFMAPSNPRKTQGFIKFAAGSSAWLECEQKPTFGFKSLVNTHTPSVLSCTEYVWKCPLLEQDYIWTVDSPLYLVGIDGPKMFVAEW